MTTYGALGAAILAAIPDWLKIPAGFALIACLIAWWRPPGMPAMERLLRARWTPIVLGLTAVLGMTVAWGSLRQVPLLQDEAAYLLQAHLFAAGRWADPSPPIPAFFEQPHVLVVPKLASKYFPGHSLLLAPGVWLGFPGLVPVILLGFTGALLFALARDVLGPRFGPWAALLAYVLWLSLLGYSTWPRPSYMSEITTSALWLAGWWALLRWREQARMRYAVAFGLCLGWGAITRPLTMVAYGLVTGAVALVLVWRRRRWGHLLVAAGCGAAVLAIIPLWSARTTGSWRLTPHTLYTAQYLPWDVVGFGYKDTPPLRSVPPEIACLDSTFAPAHRLHEPPVLPGQLVARTWGLLDDTFDGWRRGLLLCLVVGLVAMPAEVAIAAATSLALVTCYLVYPQDPRYSVYYMEAQTTLVAIAALGLCTIAGAVGAARARTRERTAAARREVAWWVVGALVCLIPTTIFTVRVTGERHAGTDVPRRHFVRLIHTLPEARTIVFVRYPSTGPCEQPEHSLIDNAPPLATARTWIVYDRGAEDAALLARVPDRVPYVFDVESGVLQRMSTGTVAAGGRP